MGGTVNGKLCVGSADCKKSTEPRKYKIQEKGGALPNKW